MIVEQKLAMALSALGNQTRLSLFRRLQELGQAGSGATSLAETAGLQRELVSYHLRPLVAVGLVVSRKSGRDVIYSVDRKALADFALAVQGLALA